MKNPRAELADMPGHQIRRLHQIAVAIFLQDTQAFGITPVQFAALWSIFQQPGIDQSTLAGRIGHDTSTLGGVIDRLEARDLVQRVASPQDRRVRQLQITDQGKRLLEALEPGLRRSQERILAPLPPASRKQFMAMLAVLVDQNNELSRAPAQG